MQLLTDLPIGLVAQILSALDLNSLCSASRTCVLLNGVARQPALWPGASRAESLLSVAARNSLAAVTRLPPQASSCTPHAWLGRQCCGHLCSQH
jgi:hypothetical protein